MFRTKQLLRQPFRISGKTGEIRQITTKCAQREAQYIPVYFGADCARQSVDVVREALGSALTVQ